MKIAIIGSGNVGAALASNWIKAGHEITFGTRDVNSDKIKALLANLGAHACADTPAVAAKWGEVVVLATPWQAAQATLAGLGDLGGKPLLDAINPLGANMQLDLGHTTSASEKIAGWASNARVVKAFNVGGAGTMADTHYPDGKPSLFFCGDDADAKKVAAQLAGELGYDPVDCGPLSVARLLEPMAKLWISLAYVQGLGPNVAFRLIRR